MFKNKRQTTKRNNKLKLTVMGEGGVWMVLWQGILKVVDVITKLVLWMMFFFEDIRILANAVMALIVIDWIMGTWRAKKENKFNWKEFKQGYLKLIVYLISLMALFIFEKFLATNGKLYFTTVLAVSIGVEEAISILRNGRKILGGDQKHLTRFMSQFIKETKNETGHYKGIKKHK